MKKEDMTTMAVGMMHLNGMTYPALDLLRDPDHLNTDKEVNPEQIKPMTEEEAQEEKE